MRSSPRRSAFSAVSVFRTRQGIPSIRGEARVSVDPLFDGEPLEVRVERALLRGHETGPHRDPLRPQGQRRRQPPAVREAAGRDDRDLHRVHQARDEDERGHRLAVGRRLVAGRDHPVRPVLLGAFRVAGVDHGRDHLAAVLMGPLDDPVALPQREVDDRDLLREHDLRVFRGARDEERGVAAEGLVGQAADLPDRLPRLFRVEGTRGENAQPARIGDGRHHLRNADPAHAGEKNGILDAEQFGDARLHRRPPF